MTMNAGSIGACGLAAGTGATVIGPSICQCAYLRRIGPSTCQCAFWHRIRPACPCALCDRFASNPCGFPGHSLWRGFPPQALSLPPWQAISTCRQQQGADGSSRAPPAAAAGMRSLALIALILWQQFQFLNIFYMFLYMCGNSFIFMAIALYLWQQR